MKIQRLVLVYAPLQPASVSCGITSAVNSLYIANKNSNYSVELENTTSPNERSVNGLFLKVFRSIFLTLKVVSSLLEKRPVLIEVHTPSGRGFFKHSVIVIVARIFRVPALLRIHGGNFKNWHHELDYFSQHYVRLVLRVSSRLVVLSKGWERTIKDIEPAALTAVIPNSIDVEYYSSFGEDRERQSGRILVLAGLCEQKGQADAIRALAEVQSAGVDCSLILCGDEREPGAQNRLWRLAQELGVLSSVQFMGNVTGAQKKIAFRSADIMLLPSYVENMPISIMEGMAAGLPIICTRVGAIPEMITSGFSGLIVDAGDCHEIAKSIIELMGDFALRVKLAKNAFHYAQANWDSTSVFESTVTVYDDVVNS